MDSSNLRSNVIFELFFPQLDSTNNSTFQEALMSRLVVLLVLLATYVYCQLTPCCFPDQWEATEGIVSGSVDDRGHSAIELARIALSVDADSKRIHAIETVEAVDSTPKTYIILQLYQQNVQYLIQNTTCTRSPLGSWNNQNCMPGVYAMSVYAIYLQVCVSDTAYLVRRYRLGLNESIQVADFAWGADNSTQFIMGVTESSCVPVTLQYVVQKQGAEGMNWAGFLRPTLGIKYPNIFDIPDMCKGPGVIDRKWPVRGSVFFTR